jgi:glycosyltransferase involved in cell wall biosynthesis
MSATEPQISVMIPAFDAGPYLGEAIESALTQSLPPSEVIVVDDGSEDDTLTVARSFGERVRAVRQERGGNGAARNTAVSLASGNLYAFLDADDRFTPDKLLRQWQALEDDGALHAVFGHVQEFVSPELPAEVRAGLRPATDPQPWASPNLMLIHRDAFDTVGLFATNLRVGVTVDWYARATEVPLRTLVLPDVVLERRLHSTNNGIREQDARSQYIQVLRASIQRRRQAGR